MWRYLHIKIDSSREKVCFYRFVWDEDDAADTWYEEICFRDLTELKPSSDGYMFVQF